MIQNSTIDKFLFPLADMAHLGTLDVKKIVNTLYITARNTNAALNSRQFFQGLHYAMDLST